MRTKQLLFSALFVIQVLKLTAQVNAQKGTLQKSIPIFSYKNPGYPNLGVNIRLEYNSGNGLVVDAITGNVGTGWSVEGIARIVRIQKGLPDDQVEIPGSWNYGRRPPGYIYNTAQGDKGCPVAMTNYPIFGEDGHTYYEDNVTTADRELDEFRLEINGRIIPFVLNKSGGDCINLDNSKVKITPNLNTSGNLSVSPVDDIRGFIVIDEMGTKYEFGEAEVYRSFNYIKDESLTFGCYNAFLKSSDPLLGPEYVINAWYVSTIKPINECDINAQIRFEYITQVYDNTHPEPKYVGIDNYSGPIINPDQLCTYITVTLPPPYNTTITKSYSKLLGQNVRDYILKKEIKKITIHDNETVEFDYNTPRKDLQNTNALSQISVKQDNITDYSYLLEQSYFIKNEIKQPGNTQEEKWSRLCLKSVKKVSGNGSLEENPVKFEYYTGTNNTEDFVPPAFFHAKDHFGYYNGNFSGVPTDRFLGLESSDETNWVKVCTHNYATINGQPNEIVYNPKPNYARNGLLKSITYPTGGKELYEYEQIYIKPTIYDYLGLTYKSFTTRNAPDNSVEYAYGGVSVSKISFFSQDNSFLKSISYDYKLPGGGSSFWGAENGRAKSFFASFYTPVHQVFDPITGICSYEFAYPGLLQQLPTPATPASLSTLKKILNVYNKIMPYYTLLTNTYQAVVAYIIKYLINASNTCGTGPSPVPVPENRINFSVQNANPLPVQYNTTKITETDANGVANNGYILNEFTTTTDFPLLIPYEVAEWTYSPRGYFWMYGLPKKITVYDNTGAIVKQTENTYAGNNNQVPTNISTRSCNCTPQYFGSTPSTNWWSAGNINNFITTSTSDIKVDFYNIAKGNAILTSSKETLYKNGNSLITNTDFTYNSLNNEISKTSTTDSKGRLIETKNYYVDDYNLANPANAVLNQLKNKNAVAVPISTETWQTAGSSVPELLSTSITEFGTGPFGEITPNETYGLEWDKPVSQNVIGVFDPNQLIRNSQYIKPITQINHYYCVPYPKEVIHIASGEITSFLYSYPEWFPVATISNAGVADCDYIASADLTTNSTFFSRWGINKPSKLTFWTDNDQAIKVAIGVWNGNAWVYNDISPVLTTTIDNTMKYVEFDIPTGNIQLEVRNINSCQMKEFRFYPKNASMATRSYDAAGRKISECDINNRTTYYEYDGLGRISKVMDDRHNIIKTYEYHFKN